MVDGFAWPESDLNLLGPVRVSCNCGNVDTTVVSLQAVRNCTGSYTEGARWMGLGNSTACQFSSNIASLCGLTTVSGPRNIIITIYIPYSRKFSLDKECCPTRLPLYCKYILCGINFCPCSKGHHRFCVIINKNFGIKISPMRAGGKKGEHFKLYLFSWYTCIYMILLCFVCRVPLKKL